MAKKKGKKPVQMNTSPESYIKTRARNLPIGKCYINESWKQRGFATIIVTRNHTNGNFTFGVYLVDTFCLGVKDSMYDFNSYEKYLDLLDKFDKQHPMIEIDYSLAHNIIYGSLKYAASLGFKPAKSFEISQNILEEADARIKSSKIKFGFKGKPAIFVGTEKHPENIIATLERSVGKGNFIIITLEDLDDDEDDDDDDELTDEKASPENIATMIFRLYEDACTEKEREEMYKIIDECEAMDVVKEDDTDDPSFVNEDRKLQYQLLYGKIEQNPVGAIPEIKTLIAENPDDYSFYSLLNVAYETLGDKAKAHETIVSAYKKFPQKITAFAGYIFVMSEQNNFDDLKKLIGSNFNFHQFFPNRQKISFNEMVSLTVALFLYFSKGLQEIHKGVAYAITLCDFIFNDKNKKMVDEVLSLASSLMMQEIDDRKELKG